MEGKTDWKSYREEFPAAEKYIYFNSAAISPMSLRVRAAIEKVNDIFVDRGILGEEEVFGRATSVRESAARLIGAQADEIAFVRNTTHGVFLAANAINWKKGDNVVLPAFEFPANVYPWMGLIAKGVELRLVDPDEGRVTPEMLMDVCDARTRAVTVSYVQFSTGYRIDCGEIGSFCRDRGIFFHVDAIQALGAVQIDVKRDKIDLLSCGGHKWLLTMPGIGIFYCRKELIEQLGIPLPGWTGVVDRDNYLDYVFEYRGDASRYEEGSPNLQGIFGLGASAERFLEIGTENVEKRILHLTGLLSTGLKERGFEITSPFNEPERSGIICFNRPEDDIPALHDRLWNKKIVCSLREGSIRLSPHIYNNEEDIGEFFKILEVVS